MKIFILTMEDPLYSGPFLKEVIRNRKDDICGVALIKKGDRLTVYNKKSKFIYLLSLFIILGPFYFIENGLKTISYKFKKQLSIYLSGVKSPSILKFAERHNIPVFEIGSPNNDEFLNILREYSPDLIISQTTSFLGNNLLSIPKIGILNRHNALLPKNRGRLTPFWVKYKKEKETGVSIHFMDEKLDSGSIVVQEKFEVKPTDSIKDIVKKNYEIAPKAIIKAIDKLKQGDNNYLENNDEKATYNSTPSLKDAIKYRLGFTYQGK